MNLMWFRNDLRVHDNPALFNAISSGPTIAVYCLAQDQWRKHDVAPIKQNLILRQLVALKDDLNEINVPLLVVNSHDFSGVISQLDAIFDEYNITEVMFNHEYEWNENQLTELVSTHCINKNIHINGFHDQCLITPGTIHNKQGGYYKVFTAFKKAYLAQLSHQMRPLYRKPNKQEPLSLASNITCAVDALRAINSQNKKSNIWQVKWPVGEQYVHDVLAVFVEKDIDQYHVKRDIPNVKGTSKLSAYLAIGIISVRQCYQAALSMTSLVKDDGTQTWIVELIWRDFYRHLMVSYPEVCRYKPFKVNTDQLPWKQSGPLFKAWCEGKTGYPIVDAAMRQLVQTGWMHNRLRMISAMFLTKHLFIDWRLGEQFFMQHLIDGDLASNNGGWQWSASTGVDAVPYFRIFNPTRQSQRFDPDGDFIRRYVTELNALDASSIHQPSTEQIIQCGYMEPVVNHKQAVELTKHWFKQLSDNSNYYVSPESQAS
ncbi:deoxyribodipyrimidine photo-lyase [Oceaniserpentilla sp. 4NH20-0058]|uniref:deoxyribodipyrimidine photo-lyase n=1 Tax=Oceaniserpentilla sp. 4NH20-0058 TaxID=3127660 RepID=UPI0031034A6A